MLTLSLGQVDCPSGFHWDSIEGQCVAGRARPVFTTMRPDIVDIAPAPPPAPPTPIAPTVVLLPPQELHPERPGWKWWYWLLLAGGVGGTGALLYYGLKR